MKLQSTVTKHKPTLMHPGNVPVGEVYSWGTLGASYLRVRDGSVDLQGFYFLPLSHSHFSTVHGPMVQVADKADLCINYKG